MQHIRRDAELSLLKAAKDEGFKQIHIAVLAWCRQPAAIQISICRVVVMALEAAFHYLFWSMPSTNHH